MDALFWKKHSEDSDWILCSLCAHGCVLKNGTRGRCGVRINQNGQMVSLVRNVISSLQMDPVEKKPLYHFLPGTKTFSIGSVGCNFSCRFCQNFHISTLPPDGVVQGRKVSPEELLKLALTHNAKSIAFTYNEPTIFSELILDTVALASAQHLPVIFVSNGFMSKTCLETLRNKVQAINVDLKSFNDDFYRVYCGGRLQPVLDNLKTIKQMGWWLEVTTLVIPGLNDSEEELRKSAQFICKELGADTPWHLSAFHGAYHMENHPSTTLQQLETAWQIGKSEGLHFVYIGNVVSATGGNTYCPHCGTLSIERRLWQTRCKPGGACPQCGAILPGVWA